MVRQLAHAIVLVSCCPFLFAQGADECANADLLAGVLPVFAPFSTVSASDTGVQATNSAEQQCATLSDDVWFRWTAPSSGTAVFNTCDPNTSFDTELAVWSDPGGGCGALVPEGCVDDACLQFQSAVSVSVIAGTQYYLQIGHWNAVSGDVFGSGVVSITLPSTNDTCGTASPLGVGVSSVTTLMSTPSGVQPTGFVPGLFGGDCPDPADMFTDAWFAFVSPACGTYVFSICNVGYDSRLALYSGSCSSLAALACNDEVQCGLGPSEVIQSNMAANQTFYVQVGGGSPSEVGSGLFDVGQIGVNLCEIGTYYCSTSANSQSAAGSLISARGSTSLAANNFTLTAANIESGEPGIFFYGTTPLAGTPFGEGLRCVGGTVVRIQPPGVADASGTLARVVDNTLPGIAGSGVPFVSGAAVHFQCWYRDPSCPDCNGDMVASGFNLTDAVSILWQM